MNSTVQLHLENYTTVCYPGQTLAGRVECIFDKEKSLRAVRIKFRGRAKTHWAESESYYDTVEKKRKTRLIHYSGEEVYFNAEYNLITGGENFTLPAGCHKFPFSYILPAQLPSSYDGVYGDIRYTVTGTVDRPWKFDYKAKIVLNLVSPLDLNYVPGLREPVATSVDKNLCCFWCKSGPLSFDLSLPASGYVPGQDVNIGAYVQNMSNVSVECVKFKIYQEIEFIAHYPSTRRNFSTHTIQSLHDGGIGAHGEKSWTSKLLIPANFPNPNLLPCGIISMSYRLYGEVVLPCPHSNLVTEFPFTIGTVPLSGVNFDTPGAPPTMTQFPISNSQIIPYDTGTSAPPEMTPLINNTTTPFPNNGHPYLPEKNPYAPMNLKPVPYHLTSTGEPSSTYSGVVPTSTPYSPTAPPGAPTGPPYSCAVPYAIGRTPGSMPYPPEPTQYPPRFSAYPLEAAGVHTSSSAAPPSYEEANQLKENNEK